MAMTITQLRAGTYVMHEPTRARARPATAAHVEIGGASRSRTATWQASARQFDPKDVDYLGARQLADTRRQYGDLRVPCVVAHARSCS